MIKKNIRLPVLKRFIKVHPVEQFFMFIIFLFFKLATFKIFVPKFRLKLRFINNLLFYSDIELNEQD